jgi:hypothetical protein
MIKLRNPNAEIEDIFIFVSLHARFIATANVGEDCSERSVSGVGRGSLLGAGVGIKMRNPNAKPD